jgi:hypothetical protein
VLKCGLSRISPHISTRTVAPDGIAASQGTSHLFCVVSLLSSRLRKLTACGELRFVGDVMHLHG